MKRPDRHNEIEVNFLEKGSLTYLLAGRKVTVTAGSLSLFWAAIPHQIIGFEGDQPYYVVTIPFAWFLGLKLPDRLLQPVLHGACVREPDAQRESYDRTLFMSWLEDFQSGQPPRLRVAQEEIEVRLRRLALSLPDESEHPRLKNSRHHVVGEGGLSKVEQMAAFIARHYAEDLSAQRIGEAVGLHPNYAMNLFQSAFGTTLFSYLTELRVSSVQRLLITTHDSIATIALNSGFNSISRFNAAFKSICGCSPSAYRATNQASLI